MQPNANTESNRAPEVEPAIKHTVPWRITSIDPLAESRLRVTFVDGTAGEVDMKRFLNNPNIVGTVFEALRDRTVFAEVHVVLGAAQWPNGADLAPDAMYDAIREGGEWVVE